MRKIINGLCCLISFVVMTSCNAAGPFGLSKGMTLDQIDFNAQQIDHGVYATQKIPNPHSSFKRYSLVIGPTTGLCKVRAVGKSITTNPSGDQLRKEFINMRGRLEKIYGKGETQDFVEAESRWKDPAHFMMSLKEKDRMLATIWIDEDISGFEADIESVSLRAFPMRSDRGFLILEYEFVGFDECIQEIYKRDNLSLSSL